MNITYYLGAGASANALPLVSSLPSRFKKYIEYLTDILNEDNAIFSKAKIARKPAKEFILSQLNTILQNIEEGKHFSVLAP